MSRTDSRAEAQKGAARRGHGDATRRTRRGARVREGSSGEGARQRDGSNARRGGGDGAGDGDA